MVMKQTERRLEGWVDTFSGRRESKIEEKRKRNARLHLATFFWDNLFRFFGN